MQQRFIPVRRNSPVPAWRIPGSFAFSGSEVRRATAAFDGGLAISDAGPGGWDRRTGRSVRSAALRGASRTVVASRAGGGLAASAGRPPNGPEHAPKAGAAGCHGIGRDPGAMQRPADRFRASGFPDAGGPSRPGNRKRTRGPGLASPASPQPPATRQRSPSGAPATGKPSGPPHPRRNMKRRPDPHPGRKPM